MSETIKIIIWIACILGAIMLLYAFVRWMCAYTFLRSRWIPSLPQAQTEPAKNNKPEKSDTDKNAKVEEPAESGTIVNISSANQKGKAEIRLLEADQYYYLPAASLNINAIATVLIVKTEEHDLPFARLSGMELKVDPVISTDDDWLFTIRSVPNMFFDEEWKITTSSAGLLEGVAATITDSLPSIVARVAGAPAEIFRDGLSPQFMKPEKKHDTAESILEVRKFERKFFVSSRDVKKENIPIEWIISIDGAALRSSTVDATFQIHNPQHTQSVFTPSSFTYSGIVSRPMKWVSWDVYLTNQANGDIANGRTFETRPATNFSCNVPDTSALLTVPLKRGWFVKKEMLPRFSQGLLVENYSKKPSELEAFISIPINILKAIVSIPAHLLHFKITRNLQQAEYIKSLQTLLEEKNQLNAQLSQAEKSRLQERIDLLQSSIGRTSGAVPGIDQQLPVKRRLSKLGKLDPQPGCDKTDAMFEGGVDKIAPLDKILQEPLPEVHWEEKIRSWNGYNNDRITNCVPVAAAHLITAWTANTVMTLEPSEKDVMDALAGAIKLDPQSTDGQGCRLLYLMRYWRDSGIGKRKIERFITVNKKKLEWVKLAVCWFGGCIIGLKMPPGAQQDEIWGQPQGRDTTNDGDPKGHCVAVVGYTPDYLVIVSVDQPINITNKFFEDYNDETFIALSPSDWTVEDRTLTNPSWTVSDLRKAMVDIKLA